MSTVTMAGGNQLIGDPELTRQEAAHPEVFQSAVDFESIFVQQMVDAMDKTVDHGGLIPESSGEKIYRSMLNSEYAKQISQSGQLGLEHMIFRHLLRNPAEK